MNKQWMLYVYVLIAIGVSFILAICAPPYIYSGTVDGDVVKLQMTQVLIINADITSMYEKQLNSFSQQVYNNETDEDTVEWMFRGGRRTEEDIPLQGYALGWDFYEEQTCAARNLLGLQHWATSLDFGVVEPFVVDSYFRCYSFRNEKSLRLSDYFDIDVWNYKVKHTIPNGTPLVKWEEFIKKAARQIIVVHTVMRSSEGTKIYFDEEMKNSTCIFARGFTNSTLAEFGFKIVRQVCFKFDIKEPVPITEYNKNILGPFNASDVTIVFALVPGVNRPRINISPDFYHHKFVDWLTPSKRVINDAKRYIDMFLAPGYVAVSMRAFKIGINLRVFKPANITEATTAVANLCVDEIAEILSSFSGQHFMTVDMGAYGDPKALSYISHDAAVEIINKMINITYHNSWDKVEWEDSFAKATDGIRDSGYIASVQKEIVSRASTVIVAGGGTFQDSMMLQHKTQINLKHDIVQVCKISELYKVYNATKFNDI